MTKRITNIFYIVMASLLFFSCKKDLPTLDMSKAEIKATTTTALINWVGFAMDDPSREFVSYTISPVSVGVDVPVQYVVEMAITQDFTGAVALNKFMNISKDTSIILYVQPIDSILQKSFKLPTGASTPMYVRIRVNALNQNNEAIGDTINNIVGNYTVGPIYKAFELLPYNLTTPNLWYLVGSMAASPNDWKNDVAHLGSGLWPLSVVAGNNYDVQGNGLYEATFYFTAGTEFKIINKPGNWNPAFGSSSGNTTVTYFATGGDNIKIPTTDWYKISLNSIENTCTITTTTAPTKNYPSMSVRGNLPLNWDPGTAMLATMPSDITHNHMWYLSSITIGAGVKLADSDWFGGDTFPIGTGKGGNNIPSTAGTYTVIFNDIDGFYYFIKQ